VQKGGRANTHSKITTHEKCYLSNRRFSSFRACRLLYNVGCTHLGGEQILFCIHVCNALFVTQPRPGLTNFPVTATGVKHARSTSARSDKRATAMYAAPWAGRIKQSQTKNPFFFRRHSSDPRRNATKNDKTSSPPDERTLHTNFMFMPFTEH
jgi:hypothetical protein